MRTRAVDQLGEEGKKKKRKTNQVLKAVNNKKLAILKQKLP
jgi:hypothetical protein